MLNEKPWAFGIVQMPTAHFLFNKQIYSSLNLRVIIPGFCQLFLAFGSVPPQPRYNLNGNLINGFLVQLFIDSFLNRIIVVSGGGEQPFTLCTVIPLAGKNLVSKLIYGFLNGLFLAVICKADIAINIVSAYSVKSPLSQCLTVVVL